MSKRPTKQGATRGRRATFRDAVADAPSPVSQAYRPGKQALERRHRTLVTCSDTQRLTGSIDLDATLAQEPDYANQSRWDYGIGHKPTRGPERAVWVEVHTATTREVSTHEQRPNATSEPNSRPADRPQAAESALRACANS